MKKVAVIQDMSSFGKCSLTAALPVLSVMGVQACPLPTAILTAQTEFPSFFCEDLTSKMSYFTEEWHKMGESFEGILTGFVMGEEQIGHTFDFLDTFQKEETIVLVDPVMGDQGEGYPLFTGRLLERMKELVKRANIITPNITECCMLTGLSYEKLHSYSMVVDYLQALEEAAHLLAAETKAKVVLTGIVPPARERVIGNLLVADGVTAFSQQPFNGAGYSGTGDLFAATVIGGVVRGQSLAEAIQLAEQFLTAAISETYEKQIPRNTGVHFEKYLKMLI
ncbi:pyridoxamine kinase [Metasolibacillus meyeri]|uniref:pyridoxal kinase n=1 Tax=Metasolibacillus meyeri TaxID=1071052 RepID=A0AAW9NP70_9BACL|nr:pyridoxamine kinase [Metasolibacillus meyeri]MEC1177815.1 pyridoxamine kinase [Metasolibacillus meyeri]